MRSSRKQTRAGSRRKSRGKTTITRP
jgi:hypothetical protein